MNEINQPEKHPETLRNLTKKMDEAKTIEEKHFLLDAAAKNGSHQGLSTINTDHPEFLEAMIVQDFEKEKNNGLRNVREIQDEISQQVAEIN